MNIQRCKKLCTKALVHGIYFSVRCFELGTKLIHQACAQARWNKNSIFALAFKIPADVGIV